MIGSMKNGHYEMSETQFEEMKDFYKKLGYNPSQVKTLTDNCFGIKVKVSKNAQYREDWSFPVVYNNVSEGGIFRGMPPRSVSMMGGIMPNKSMPSSNPIQAVMNKISINPGANKMPQGIRSNANSYSAGESSMDFMAAPAPMPMGAQHMMSRQNMMQMPLMETEAMPEVITESFNTSETHVNDENEAYSPLDNPQAIFSANVNTASWDYLRSKMNQKTNIDKSFVRVEEIINSYLYDFEKPGKDELFSLSAEKCKCPWNPDAGLMLVGMKAKEVPVNVKQNLVFLVDVSGSMQNQWILVNMSLAAIVSRLKDGDTLSVISYSDKTTVVSKNINGSDKEKCVEALSSIEGTGGCTRGSEGLEQAYKYLSENYDKKANNRLFIFTDGDFNFGITSEGQLKDFIYKKRETGIYLSIVGYGFNNFKDNKMETLAYNGNGNYTFVSNPYDIYDNLCDKLISNLVTVAKDVKISVELNPAFVSSYRLIGYEFRALTQQEFHDTKKATDGIGSGHNVVALIEYKKGKAKKQYSSRYVSSKAKKLDDEFAFIEVHYKSPDDKNLETTKSITVKEIESADKNNIKVARLLAAFGLCVTDSKYKGNADKKLLEDLMKDFERSGKYDMNKKYSHFDIIRKYIQS